MSWEFLLILAAGSVTDTPAHVHVCDGRRFRLETSAKVSHFGVLLALPPP